MTIEVYIKKRNKDISLQQIQKDAALSDGTVYTLELGYQCYLKKIPLDQAIKIIQATA